MATLDRHATKQERAYLTDRAKVVGNTPSGVVANNPFLFARRQTVTEMLIRVKLYEAILDVSGSIVECGVAQGNNLMLYSHLSSILEPYAINRRIVGFDSFEGFRSLSTNDPNDVSESDFSDVSDRLLQQAIALYDRNRAAGHMPRTEIVKGDALSTIPDFVAAQQDLTIALLYLDFDLYEPTRVSLQHLLPLVVKGGIVALDEFSYRFFPGETQALKEILELNKTPLRRFPFDPFMAYFRV